MAITRITKGVIKPNENYDTHNIVSTGIITSVGADINGDLDVDGHTNLDNVSISGVTTFAGSVSNLVLSGVVTTTGLDVNGNADISGNMSVGGVLTYEDVTSIDSIGIITARNDIHVGTGVSAVGVGTFGGLVSTYADIDDFLDVGSNIQLGNAGVVTATTFKGDGDFVDIDVDGHTNLDNVSIVGVTTFNLTNHPEPLKIISNNTANNISTYLFTANAGNHDIRFEHNYAGNWNIHDHMRLVWSAPNETYPTGDLFSIQPRAGVPGFTYVEYKVNDSSSGLVEAYRQAYEYQHFMIRNSVVLQLNQQGIGVTNRIFHYGYNNDFIQFGHHLMTFNIGSATDSRIVLRNNQVTFQNLAVGVDINADLDVDGHTNLDNVSVAGVSTFAGNTDFGAGIDVTGNITVSGTVDGVDIAALNSSKLSNIVEDTSPQLGADLDTNGFDINFDANKYLTFASTSSAGQIYHTGSHFYVWNGTGNTQIHADQIYLKSNTGSENMLRGVLNGTVELYYDNVKTFETTNQGIKVTGTSTNTQVRLATSNGTVRGYLYANPSDEIYILDAQAHSVLRGKKDGTTALYYNNQQKLDTTNTGINITGNVVGDGLTIDGNADLNGNLDVSGTLDVSDVVGITSSLNVTGITSINGGYAPQPFTVIGGSHPTAGYNHRQQFVFRTSHGHTDLKFENSYGGNWAGNSVSHTRLLWESYGERGGSVPGGDYGRQGEFCSIQPIMGVPGQFFNLIFKGNDGVVGLSTMMRMYTNKQQLCVNGNVTAQVDQVGLGITGNIYHINDWNSNYSAYDTYFGFPGNNTFYLVTNDTEKFRVDSNLARFQNLSQGVDINSDLDVDGHTNLDNLSVAGVSTFSGLVDCNGGATIDNIKIGVDTNEEIGTTTGNLVLDSAGGTVNVTDNLSVTGNITGAGDFTLTDTATDSSAGPEFKLFRNSSSPADADYLGQIKFAGESDTGVERNYAKITGKILDASNGTEDGIIEFAHIKAGSQTITGRWRSDSLQLLNGTALTVAGSTTVTGNIIPSSDSATDIGTNGVRFANIYADTLYGDGSNLTGVTSVGGNTGVDFNDSVKARFGTGNDLEIFHDGSHTYIENNSSGGELRFIQQPSSSIIFRANVGGGDITQQVGWDIDGSGNWVPNMDSMQQIGYTNKRPNKIYADNFYGDGSNLTGISGVTINSNADNRIITGSGTAATLNGESNLTYNGSNLALAGNDNQYITIGASADLTLKADGSNSAIVHNGDGDLIVKTEGSNENIKLQSAGYTHFLTGGGNERVRIDSSGRVLIGTTTEGHGNADELTISFNNTGVSGGDQGRCGMTIRSGDNTSGVTQNGYIYFSDGTSGGNEYKGVVAYSHSDDSMYFSTNETERLRIRSSGQVQFSNGTFSDNVDCIMANGGTMEIGAQSTMKFRTATNERLRIDSAGQVLPGADDAQNLGSSSKRWANIYAADMHFSNKGKTNDVDGTWGDWTLQEGEDSVFMINNRTGKKFAITMKEVN